VTDRGVSDVVGFVLVFALVVATVGVVYTTGLTGLQSVRHGERVTNAERAFDVLQSNGNDVLHRGAPARSTEIRLSGARLGPGDPVDVNVTAGPNESVHASVTPLVYSLGDTRLVYVEGAVIRVDHGYASMRSPPSVQFGSRALVPLVDTYFPSQGSINGQTRVLVGMRVPTPNYRSSSAFTDTGGTVNVTVTTTRPGPWKRYFASHGASCTEASDGNRTAVTCELSADAVVVSRTSIGVSVG